MSKMKQEKQIMNKKGTLGQPMSFLQMLFPFILLFIFLGGFISLIYLVLDRPKRIACQELGFVGAGAGGLFLSTCEDGEGNLHYVKQECSLFKCTAKRINVGEVCTK